MLENQKVVVETTPNSDENWFESWFDSPYYHVLYQNRDEKEAQLFMDNLVHFLNLPEDAKILDLACGKGRHSIYLNALEYDVTGVDLSENSIKKATEFSNEKLNFKVHDMRNYLNEKYDAIFNLFTSFGYFNAKSDNLKALNAIKNGLTETGFAVIDFMNVDYVLQNLIAEEEKIVDGITFFMKRYYKDAAIFKEIQFEDQGKKYHFTEKVQAIRLEDFETMMEETGLYLLAIFGDYKLKKFHKNESERLILIFK